MANGALQRMLALRQRGGRLGLQGGFGVRQTINPLTGSTTMPLGGSRFPPGMGGQQLQGVRFPAFLGQGQQQQRGARAGLGMRQGPPASQMKMAFPGQDPRRNVFGGRQFGQRTRTARSVAQEFLRRGSFGQGGGFQRNPMSFGILGRGAGRLGQRTR